ncbi:uncharacterized protein LOC106711480 [Papilio machaon]|uniref:uncharacterized protein LOC106711480 n=1 Tax=Papilio machaon TaxID=76193 RepID=UPI001E664C0E|nr:uncharacterized protein LOC106711480 [Papilio machaon]
MYCPHKNSYLQLTCAVNPRVINAAVDRAMQVKKYDPHTELPPAQRLESMQPSLFAPHVDITRATLGFGRTGLRLLVRDLHSPDPLIQLQAIHSVLDQVQISENAMFLIDQHVAHRLVDLMLERNPVIGEKVCNILSHLANYYQGRTHILTRPVIISNLMWLLMRGRKEVRYAAGHTLCTLSRHLCCCEALMKENEIIENLLKMIRNDHVGIVLLLLETLMHLTDWDPEPPLKANAFQVMLALFNHEDPRIVASSMDCMAKLCCHSIGRELADIYDITFVLKPYLTRTIKVKISAVGLMQYTTLTTRSKWRAKEICYGLTKILVSLCQYTNSPILQLRAMQVLINLCDCPDIRYYMKTHCERKVKKITIGCIELWDGTDELRTYGLDTRIRSKSFEKITEHSNVVNLYTYIRRVNATKEQLLRSINWKPYE